MTKITLPNTNKQGKANEWSNVEGNDVAIATVVNGELNNENIAANAGIARSKLEGGAQGIAGQWYTPVVIATEQARENTAFGTLGTADEITGIVVPSNGVIRIGYLAVFKSSVSAAGKAAIFLNSTAILTPAILTGIETFTTGTTFHLVGTRGTSGANKPLETASESSTVPVVALNFIDVPVAAGTYTVSVQYAATSGSVTAKERKLWVEVHGV